LLQGDSRVKIGLFFVRFFRVALVAAGLGAAGESCGLHGKGGERDMRPGDGAAIVHCRVNWLVWEIVCPAQKSKNN